ncbi:hypothetical protein Gotur_032699 [Gossypium turneri]
MPPREEFPTKGLEGAPSNDIGWHFGAPVPNVKGNIICKLCGKVVKGGITRFKEHIAHKTGNVAPCPNVTGVIRESMMNVLKESNTKKIDKERRKDEFLSQLIEEDDEHEGFIDEVSAIRQANRESIQSQHEWHRREEFKRSTGGWDNIYEEGRSSYGSAREYHRERTSKSIPTHCLDLCLEDIGKKPSVAKVLDEAKKVTYFIYNHIWTVDLMKKYTQRKQILRPALTRFATHFIQLEEITRQKQGLREMFNSKEFKESKWGQQKSGPAYEGKKIVLGILFWKKANDLIKVYEPLVKVLRLVDSDEKPTMTFIYEAVDRAKRAIQQDCRYFTEYEKIIDNRWNFMHFELHSAGYFLNPQFQSGVEHSENVLIEILEGTQLVIERLEPSLETQVRMVNQIRHQKRMSTDDINASFNPISLDHIFEDVDPLSEWLHEKENLLLDGENAGVLPVDTSDDEIDVDQSQQQNLSHSSSSSTPSQNGDGDDGGGLSPIDEDDRYSGDREFDGNMFPEPRRERSEPRAPSKGKGKKHTSIGSSSSRRSSSSNLGYSDSSTSTQGFYPPEQPSYFQPSHGYPQPYGYYPPFPNYGVPYQPQMHPPPPMYHPPPPLMPRESSQERSQSKGEGSDLPRHSTNCIECLYLHHLQSCLEILKTSLNKERETLIHAMKECPTARAVLALGGLNNNLLDGNTLGVSIGLKLNNFIFRGIDEEAKVIWERAASLSHNFRIFNLLEKPMLPRSVVVKVWMKPPQGVVKINFDATVAGKKTSYGLLARDSDGFVLGGRAGVLDKDLQIEWGEMQY